MPEPEEIAQKVRTLRKSRGVSQGELAKLLQVSQSWLCEIEAGKGSFSAGQLIFLLKYFNVPLSHFEAAPADSGDAIQKALAHHGASHLADDRNLLPSERLARVDTAIREALLDAGSTRWIAGLAPVLVANIDRINLQKLHAQFREFGLQNRFLWLLDNVAEAVRETETEPLPHNQVMALRKTLNALEAFRAWANPRPWELQEAQEDTLGLGILSQEARNETRDKASEISRRWKILTEIQVEDFSNALRESRGLGKSH